MRSVTMQKVINDINTSSSTLFVLCGLPYSGKTCFAKQVLASTKGDYVSIDMILDQLGYDWEHGCMPDADGWKKVFQISYDRAAQALQRGISVLYDSTNHTKASRDTLRDVAEKAGAMTRVIFLDTSPEIVRQRWEKNKATKERFILPEALLEDTIRKMERPDASENAVVICAIMRASSNRIQI